jgi:Flp pilus assembly protein TadG
MPYVMSANFFKGDSTMYHHSSEKGQALIIITLAAVGIFAFAALAIDGSIVFSDKRHAQNAADTAALAAALAYSRNIDLYGNDPNPYARVQATVERAAYDRTTSNGYDSGTQNDVVLTSVDVPDGTCPSGVGKDFIVTITSYVQTTFARVIGRELMTNIVTATSRVCGRYHGPLFNGNAIVSLAPDGTGYEGNGNADWIINGGGIFANSASWVAAHCQSAASSITVPSVTVVGDVDWGNCDMNISGSTNTDATALSYLDYSSLFPPTPACNGSATLSGGQWQPQAGADGSRVSFGSGDMDFAAGLYCVTNNTVGPYHGEITGAGVTFYIMSHNFELKFNGAGNSFNASAPTAGDYAGVLIYMVPLVDANGNLLPSNQALDLRGNGDEDIVGNIIAPSAYVTMFGNSGAGALDSQVIAYRVDSGGTADIHITYNTDNNYQADVPNSLTLLK